MQLGKVVGTVVASTVVEGLEGVPMLVVQPLDKTGKAIGEKTFYNIPNDQLLTNWIKRPKPNNTPCVPLTNAIEPPKAARRDQRGIFAEAVTSGNVRLYAVLFQDFRRNGTAPHRIIP